ncbi:MAG: putative glycoside hydrolase family 15 protein, partial [Victivallaceae bacterium]|nr:putative glycoside hydrolase family 15 protein [Victivallaceae bacterium]
MKRTSVFFALLAALCVAGAELPSYEPEQHPLGGGGVKKAPMVGKKGPKIQIFNGGRAWVGGILPGAFSSAGAQVMQINAPYLDGLSGASIKTHLGDKVEPKAFDGITPALDKAAAYKLLIFNHLLPESQKLLFTPERIAKLKTYVENGGHLLVTIDIPETLGDLLPVEPGKYVTLDEVLSAGRPESEKFAMFPETLPVFRFYREAKLRDGAVALSTIRDASGKDVAPYVARIKIGKGSVTFFNTEITNPKQIKDFSNWAYSKAFFVALANDCFGGKLDAEKCMTKLEDIPARTEIGETAVSLDTPRLEIVDSNDLVQISGNKAKFGNGTLLEVAPDGFVSVTWPGKTKPYIRKYNIPTLNFSKKQKVFDSATAEAVDVKEDTTAADIKWKFSKIEGRGNEAIITYVAPGNEMQLICKIGKLFLDGRTFDGIADRIELVKSPLLVSSVKFTSELDLEKPLYAHRFDCYQPPRGYTAFDMTGKVKSDTRGFSGQPFAMIVCENGLYIGNRATPSSSSAQIIRDKGAKYIESNHSTGLGRIKAPLATAFYWQWYADGTERGHHDYLAMYQFMRHTLRVQAGLKEFPAYPVAAYGYQLTDAEKDEVIRFAGKAGYRFIFPPNPESPIESIATPSNMATYKKIVDAGARARIWTAGSYAQGDGGWIINHHPEWFVKDENGKIFKYFGTYPVIDVNNPEFYDWYTKDVLDKAIAGGVGFVYRDMDGAASGTVNYALPESPNGLKSQIKFYKYFHDKNCLVGIEGMNPLVIDIYWYRPDKYTSFAGKEFVLVASMPSDGLRGGITLDAFRTGMYACFPSCEISGAVFGVESIRGQLERTRRVLSFVPKFNEALDFC